MRETTEADGLKGHSKMTREGGETKEKRDTEGKIGERGEGQEPDHTQIKETETEQGRGEGTTKEEKEGTEGREDTETGQEIKRETEIPRAIKRRKIRKEAAHQGQDLDNS